MYQIRNQLHTIEGVISPEWTEGFSRYAEQFTKDNTDYRELDKDPLGLLTIIAGLGGLSVVCTKMELSYSALKRVDTIGEHIDTTVGEYPIRLVAHSDLVESAMNQGRTVGEDIEELFTFPTNNETWLFPSRAIDVI